MKQKEQKSKTLGQFREQVSSLEAEVTSLKRQLAGSKGRNKQLAEENRTLKNSLSKAAEERAKLVNGLESQVKELSCKNTTLKNELNGIGEVLNTYRENVDWFNRLPWYKKMFAKM